MLFVPTTTALSSEAPPPKQGQRVPNSSEGETVEAAKARIVRVFSELGCLIKCENPNTVFEDEEPGESDHYMTPRLEQRVTALVQRVKAEWPDIKLRVTEAWDEQGEHSAHRSQYEARAVDITISEPRAFEARRARKRGGEGFSLITHRLNVRVTRNRWKESQ